MNDDFVTYKHTVSDTRIYYHVKELEDGMGITLPEEEVFPIFQSKELLKSL